MTVEEWVDEIRVWHGQEARNQAIKVMRAAINAAVEEEREACAKTALRIGGSQGAFLGDWPTGKAIENAIRARSNPAE